MPYYLVKTPNDERLIEAANAAQAVRHVVKQTIEANAVNMKELVALMQGGKSVEKASNE